MIGTEKRLREEGFPQEKLKSYGLLVHSLRVIVTGRGQSEEDVPLSPQIIVSDALSRVVPFSLWKAFWKGKLILSQPGNWVITTQDPFENGFVGYLLSIITGIPLQLQIHTDPESEIWRNESMINRIRSVLYRFLSLRAENIRVVSVRVKDALVRRGVPEVRICVIPIFTEIKEFQKKDTHNLKEAYRSASHILVGMGRFEREKGFDDLLRAHARLLKTFPEAILLLVGKGRVELDLRRLSRELQIDSRVQFIPWARDLGLYYRSAHCVVIPSHYEGWGLVAVEALVSGGYVVMTDVGCAGETILHEETGLVVPPQNPKELASAVERMLLDRELRSRIDLVRPSVIRNLVTKEEFYRLQKKNWIDTYHYGKGDKA